MDGSTDILRGVEPWEISANWHDWSGLVELGLSRSSGEFSPEDIYGYLISKTMQLWSYGPLDGIPTALGITEIINYPQTKYCEIVLGAGRTGLPLDFWAQMMAHIERWAKSKGCDRVRVNGRPGWERVLGERDFHKTYTVLEKEL